MDQEDGGGPQRHIHHLSPNPLPAAGHIISRLTDRTPKDTDTLASILEPLTSLPGLTIEPFRQEDATDALRLAKKYTLDYEDALHLATAQRAEAKTIISNDKDFDKTPLTRTL